MHSDSSPCKFRADLVKRLCVKTQSRSLFFSRSTLEPNTEVFSKVLQSLALVNSVSTLLNKGGIACSRPTTSQDFCTSAKQTQTCTATPFQPCTSRHEPKARVGGNSCGQKLQSSTHFFRDAHRHLQCFKGSSHATQTQQTCQNMSVPCSCLSMHKTVKGLWKFSSSTKCSSQCLKKVNNFTCCSTEPKGKQKESYFFFSSALSRGRRNGKSGWAVQ